MSQLRRFDEAGLLLPETWVLDVSAFSQFVEAALPEGHDPHALLKASPKTRIDRAARARERIEQAALPDPLRRALGKLSAYLERKAPWGLVVRASPTCEDDSVAFMAGLSSAVLCVRGEEALGAAVRRIWGSLYLPRSLGYFARRKVRDLGVAVVFQPTISADASGVLSTRPPLSSTSFETRRGERLVNAALGLGPVVVGGDASFDIVRMTDEGAVLSSLVAEKRSWLHLEQGEVKRLDLPAERRFAPALDQAQLGALASLGKRLDEIDRDGAGFDVSFAFEGEQLFVLQGQPSHARGYPEGGDERTLWSRATVTETLAAIVSPLTFSLSEPAIDAGLVRAFQRLGCSATAGDRLVADVQGRAYLNLTALMKLAVQLPGMSPSMVGQLAGVEGLEALERELEAISRKGFYAKLPLTVARQVSDQGGIIAEVERFEHGAGDVLKTLAELDLAILPDDALVPTLRDARDLLHRTTQLLTSATTAFVTAHLTLKATLARSEPIIADRLAQALTAGIVDLPSIRPALALGRVADIARDEREARDLLATRQLTSLDDLPQGPTRRALARFIDEHGHLGISTAELMKPRWREDPSSLFTMLASLVTHQQRDADQAVGAVRSRADRERAQLEKRLPIADRLLVRALVARTRDLIMTRERARAMLLRVLAAVRTVFIDLDRRIHRIDPSLPEGSVFLCTIDELLDALHAGRPDVGPIVRLRDLERTRDFAQPDPPTTFVGAPPPVLLMPQGDRVLRGVPGASGVVTARARVVHSLRDGAQLLERGEILVAKTIDLGASPLFLVASGLVLQQGGRLTHGSVLARELGLPAVVHVPSATRAIRTGDLLRLDGDEGTVERVETVS